ncbi:TIGR00180 family glycosyltransferase [Azospirillum sp. B21]|uniref:glycosyltransferase family 2 protein n=1 Tax=Azospirillum sp. B21 TaxID=2607496 RepID=UPI0011EF0A67|nr:TIGR00180 family glycosyltransferase [Azospirillum sp. B21]KAA0577864.1 TIGR00180 family glycosyltransferase [Azospirillum sp. B21]
MTAASLTIVVPSHNRPAFLQRTLEHYGNGPYHCVIVDSSADPIVFDAAAYPCVDYRHRPGVPFATKLHECLLTVDTPYVVLSADDDMIRLDALAECVAFLDSHPGHSSVHGHFLFFLRSPNRVWGLRAYWARHDWQVAQDDPRDRQLHLMSNYMHQMYAVQRTPLLRRAYGMMDGRLHNSELMEFVVGLSVTAGGRHRTLPIFYQARQDILDSWSRSLGTGYPNLRQLYQDGADPQQYEQFLDICAEILQETAGMEREGGRRHAIRCVEAYLANEEDLIRQMAEPGVFHRDLMRIETEAAFWPDWGDEALRDIAAMAHLAWKHEGCGLDAAILDEFTGLDASRPIYIYGTGGAGRALAARLDGLGLSVAGYIDSFHGGTVEGRPCLTVQEYRAVHRPDDMVLIASCMHGEIRRTLEEAGIINYRVAYFRAMLP